MKFVAAYLLACLGGEEGAPAPGKDDVRRILEAVGAEVEDDRLELLFRELDGRDVADLIAAGREKLAYAPSCGAAVAVAAAAPAAAEEEKKPEKEEEKVEEDDDDLVCNLFDFE
ncbi:hypothetical protein ACP70R_023348 [Stipagrostis hirtigluma subsp. patula]